MPLEQKLFLTKVVSNFSSLNSTKTYAIIFVSLCNSLAVTNVVVHNGEMVGKFAAVAEVGAVAGEAVVGGLDVVAVAVAVAVAKDGVR